MQKSLETSSFHKTKSSFSSMSHKPRLLLYPDSFLNEKLQPQPNKPDSSYRSASHYCLAKYSPKFYKRLEISSKTIDWKIFKDIKQIKSLNHLNIEMEMTIEFLDERKVKKFTERLRRLLQNKRKNMKSIPVLNNRSLLELGMFLPRIKILNLSSKWRYGLFGHQMKLKDSEKKMWRFYKRFWMFYRYLEHVKMLECDDDLPLLIKGLKKHHKVLASLKTFALGFETPKEYFSFLLVQSFMKANLSLRNSPADLKLKEDTVPLSISLLLSCSTASRLNIRIGNNRNNEAYVTILKESGTLTVKIADPDLFTNQKEFPKSLENISQAISHYGKMSSPTQFRALELHFENSFNEEFLKSAFKEELSIETLVLKFSFPRRGRSYFQLAPALVSLSSFKSLKHLTIEDDSGEEYKNIAFNLKHGLEKLLPFSQLSSLEIDCLVQEATSFKDFIQLFLADQKEQKNISCSKMAFSSVQSLNEFFQTLNDYETLTEQNAYFEIHLRVSRIENVLRDFESPLTLKEKIPIEIMIDSHAGSMISQDKSEQIIAHLQKIFPQFKVTNQLPSDVFELEN